MMLFNIVKWTNMKIAVFGSGYVGLVTAACFAEVGNQVIGIDVDSGKVECLNQGDSPIYEPNLTDLLKSNHQSGHLLFTTEPQAAIETAEIIVIAVRTPVQKDGSVSLKYIDQAATTLSQFLRFYVELSG